jgi:hypothetical protein
MTRAVEEVVDGATAEILGLVWLLAHSPPTTLTADQATWGPVDGDALSPLNWRFVVHKVGPGSYDYELDGRPKAATSDADFQAILKGHGYDHTSAQYQTGTFTLDRDVAKALDPARNKDTGPLVVTYDLHALPASIHAVVTPQAPDPSADALVTREADGGGTVTLQTQSDIDASNGKNIKEDVEIKSRWAANGAGRGDAKVSGGDLGAAVTATQCWGTTFALVYASDSLNASSAVGTASDCAFGPQL